MSSRRIESDIAQIALYAALIAVLGLLPKMNIPVAGGIPITAQSLGVMLAGVMLGPIRGALAALLFLLVVALGMPLLAGGRGGMAVLMGPSVGFLLGWPLCAMVCGLVMKWTKNKSVLPSAWLAAFVGGVLVMYLCGIAGLAFKTDKTMLEALVAMLAFIPGDLIKVVIAGLVAQLVWRAMPSVVLSRS